MKKEKDIFNHEFFTNTDNYLKKLKIKYFISIIILVLLISFGVLFIVNENNKESELVKSYLGKKCSFEKDTLTIIDYSIFKETYTLSNGKEYNMDLVKNNIIK